METKFFPSHKARIAHVKQMLGTDASWAIRALEIVHAGQTAYEQTCERTTDLNGVGFTAFDAEILTSFAAQVIRWKANKTYPTPLSDKQMALLFKRMPKYAEQVFARSRMPEFLVIGQPVSA
jgi:hypothetical protein